MGDSQRELHLLLVEDNQSHADLVLLAIEDAEFKGTVDHVMDGQAAMDYLHRTAGHEGARRPDLVLLDINLPKLSGHEVLERIKADTGLRAIPVVMLTTSASEKDRQRAYNSHANSYLVKQMHFGEFQKMLNDFRSYWAVWNQPSADETEERAA